jgi:hypothetical protein
MKKTNLKIGDRVRVVGAPFQGEVGIITSIYYYGRYRYSVSFDMHNCDYKYLDLQKVKSKKVSKRKEFKYGWGVYVVCEFTDYKIVHKTKKEAEEEIKDWIGNEDTKQIYLFEIGKVWKVVTKPYQLEEI